MSSLYLKYRPKNLDEFFGNEELVHTLKGQLAEDSKQPLTKSLLFHGPTGCGKTTLARIIAAELKTHETDTHEIDTGDFRGIDTVREIRRQCLYKPFQSKYRIWIVDEVHSATRDAQNALLKILEDTPEHVIFILCTTDPQKLLPTIRGRCAQYQVKQLDDKEMFRLLRKTVKEEKEKLSRDLYNQIIQDSLGHPRNALQILGQVLAAPEEQRLKIAKQSAELQSQTIELCRALINSGTPWKKVSGILSGLKGEDAEGIRRAVLGYCQAILLGGRALPQAAVVMQEFIEPFYNTGFPGLVFACYSCFHGE